jgi:hypothetical protein
LDIDELVYDVEALVVSDIVVLVSDSDIGEVVFDTGELVYYGIKLGADRDSREANQNNAQTNAGDNHILPVRPRHRLISF